MTYQLGSESKAGTTDQFNLHHFHGRKGHAYAHTDWLQLHTGKKVIDVKNNKQHCLVRSVVSIASNSGPIPPPLVVSLETVYKLEETCGTPITVLMSLC